ncbi:hypothetical protein [Enterococcus sp.]|uniref:hypothetical protein n=1 Tax=Enterococcus sp. TaxID=35783 RepID=UPI002FCC2922
MTEEQLKQYEEICNEDANWWGHEDGYTWEEGSDHYEHLYNTAMALLESIKENGGNA